MIGMNRKKGGGNEVMKEGEMERVTEEERKKREKE